MSNNLFCEDISVEYEFKSVKFKGVVDRLIMNNLDLIKWKHNGIQNITDAPTFTSIYIDLYVRDGICQNLSFQNILGQNFCTGNLVVVYMFRYTC